MYIKGNSTPGRLKIACLNAVSLLFKSVSLVNLFLKFLRRKAYPDAFIISVDNLSFGGTGKTSLVLAIGRFLQDRGLRFAIVTRGYRSSLEKRNRSTKVRRDHSIEEVGDEARLFIRHFPDKDIYVGKNRKDSLEQAVRDGNTFILLDDGFQSCHVYKNFKIMLINPAHPYYYLRNFKWLMKREDIVLFYKNAPAHGREAAVTGGVAYGTYEFKQEGFCNARGSAVTIEKERLAGFSALGDNLRFKQDLEHFQLAGFKGYSDHYSFSQQDMESLERWRKELDADYLVCTEKDFIKIMTLNLRNIPFIYARNRIQFNIDLMSRLYSHAKEENYI
jgi:tetraacyldisaccharide 4'-kinase